VADYKLIGKNYTTPDIVAKVTGRARFAEDFRAEGMLFTKLLLSPMPHARVRHIDTSEAMRMPGVEAIITADDLPEVEPPNEAGLTNEPLYEGEPILALAAVDELTAAEAIEKVRLDLEPLPFCLDPLDSLRPGGPNARLEGNTMVDKELTTIKWNDADFAELREGRLPMGKPSDEWVVGDVEAGFAEADLVLDETIFHQSLSHQPLETRSCMAYWQNGKVYVHSSTQSTARTVGAVARYAGVDPSDVVLISEFCGGGFGSKIFGAVSMRFPILLAKKTNRPVMMRVTRMEEHFFGRARPGFQTRAKIGWRKDGRITAMDLFVVQDGGPYGRSGDFLACGNIASLNYQPLNIRMRGISVYTNTPPRGAQRAPGGVQAIAMFEPVMDKAARQLGIDRAKMRYINAPAGQAKFGPPKDDGQQDNVSSAFVREAIDKGVELFDWAGRQQRSGQRRGTKVTGVGVSLSTYAAGSSGNDGLITLRPDGKLYIQSGVGNLGTESWCDTMRASAEVLNMPWEKVEVIGGDTSKHLPWSAVQGGSQTTHAHTRASWAAGLDAKRKLQEIAARDLGGSPNDYDVGNERVYRRGNPSQGLTFASAARRAIQLGGQYDGHELPEDINGMTVRSAKALAGQGLMGVAKDNFPLGGRNMSFVVGFAEVEVDVETGEIKLVDYAATCDCGTVLHPRSLAGQLHGGGIQGFGVALGQKWVFDRRWGLGVAKRFYSNRPPTILDVPHEHEMKWAAAELPDPFNPVGCKGIGEAPVGAGAAAVLSAIADALGEAYFYRSPVSRDMIVEKLQNLPHVHAPLAAHV
jgi:xanthine dehydrogenase molybdenum-binding subunit